MLSLAQSSLAFAPTMMPMQAPARAFVSMQVRARALLRDARTHSTAVCAHRRTFCQSMMRTHTSLLYR